MIPSYGTRNGAVVHPPRWREMGDSTMAEHHMPRALFDELREEFEDVRDGYSGRGMYGARCLAVVGNGATLAQFVRYVGDMAEDYGFDPSTLHDNLQTDNMANELVFYWPDVAVSDV